MAIKKIELNESKEDITPVVNTSGREVKPGFVVLRRKDGEGEIVVSKKLFGKAFKEDKWVMIEGKKKSTPLPQEESPQPEPDALPVGNN